jgi:hypothetical protein
MSTVDVPASSSHVEDAVIRVLCRREPGDRCGATACNVCSPVCSSTPIDTAVGAGGFLLASWPRRAPDASHRP